MERRRKTQLPGFAAAATGRSVATLVVIRPGADAVEAARDAMRAKVSGIVLRAIFPPYGRARARFASRFQGAGYRDSRRAAP